MKFRKPTDLKEDLVLVFLIVFAVAIVMAL